MKFIKIQYSKIITTREVIGDAWQVINDNGELVDVLAADGTKFALPVDESGEELASEAMVIEDDVTPPFAYQPIAETLGDRIDEMALTPEQEAKIEEIIHTILATPKDETVA